MLKVTLKRVLPVIAVPVQINFICHVTQKHVLPIVHRVSIVAVVLMRNVFHGSGNVMVKKIARMVQMSQPHVLFDTVVLEHSNVGIQIVHRLQQFVMEQMTVVMELMSKIVICHVQNLITSVNRVEDVFWIVGDVMVMLIAKMEVMRIQVFVIRELVIQKLNLVVRMDVAFQNYGCVISIMIVVMILMSQLICADKEIVQLVGKDVPDNRITVVYQNGCSVMVKMIVVIIVMSFQRIVQHVKMKLISSVAIIGVFQSE